MNPSSRTLLALALSTVGCGASVSPVDLDGAAPDAAAPQDAATFSAPARLLAPLSTAVVSTPRPMLRWQLGEGATATRVELCRDRAMSRGCRAITVDRAQTSLRLEAPLDAGRWFWRARAMRATMESSRSSAVWELHAPRAAAAHEASWGARANFNGDDYDDCAIGVTGDSAAPRRIEVLHGGPSGLAQTPAQTLRATDPAALFGRAMANGSDVNGDGYTDLLVAIPTDGVEQDQLVAYHGGPEGLSAAPSWTLALASPAKISGFSRSIAGLGDLDGDGYADAAIAVVPSSLATRRVIEVYRGSADGLGRVPSQRITLETLSYSTVEVAAGGDLNGDGFAELVVTVNSARSGDRNDNYFAVYAGSAGGFAARPSLRVDSPGASDQAFATFVESAGDLDGDGYPDLVVDGLVFAGGAAGLESVARFDAQQGARLRRPASSAGDFDGDGVVELLSASEPSAQWQGAAVIIHADERFQPRAIAALSERFLQPAPSRGLFESRVASLGDVDGDGRSERALLTYSLVDGVRADLSLAVFSEGETSPRDRRDWTSGATPASSTRVVPLVVGAFGQ